MTAAAGRERANPLALAVLALLAERPAHPYEMASIMRERRWHRSIKLNFGSLYSVIEALGRGGLIFALERVREGGRPERTVYALTGAGRAELRAWLADLLRRPRAEYPHFRAGLALMPHLAPAEALALLRERAATLEGEVADRGRSLAVSQPQAARLELEYEQALAEAELAWLRGVVADLAAGRLQWASGG